MMVPSGSSLLLVLAVALASVNCLPAADPETSMEKRSEHDCLVHGYRFRHGEVFSVPGYSHCLRYLCQSGGWNIHQEACEVDGQCHPVGSVFTKDCVTYRCEKRNDNWYQAQHIRTQCKDAHGVCRGEYETFSYVLNGRLYTRCQCIVSVNGYIRYSCGSK